MTKKLYEGTKRLYAQPMTRGEYNAYRGWAIPADENPFDDGYLVEYVDGGKPNDPRHPGYISWSPRDVFERTYKHVLLPHEQRVVAEKAELDERLAKLRQFFSSPIFGGLPEAEQARLYRQAIVMEPYSEILGERIANF